ncbi:hypothetical protein JDV02_000537 [Purpureocillium takamizusanense]|uniref:Uncharacterized protein n=1 Tax=Purpureocillium takamizusanense TaxID=2060973 RepID=A0A9Q8Q7H9_9HYPO|nr:uncharacterized protein JDV02_000537 [Purpureocillium takamizusanense]UNI13837.1 hypothetical protein JDV02_000537 [Purpureocillium takamizusanense]
MTDDKAGQSIAQCIEAVCWRMLVVVVVVVLAQLSSPPFSRPFLPPHFDITRVRCTLSPRPSGHGTFLFHPLFAPPAFILGPTSCVSVFRANLGLWGCTNSFPPSPLSCA